MIRSLTAIWLSGLLLSSPTPAEDHGPPGVEILVTIRQPSHLTQSRLSGPGHAYRVRTREYDADRHTERVLEELAEAHELERVDGWLIGPLKVYCAVFRIADVAESEAVLRRLNEDARVDSAQLRQTFTVMARRGDDPYVELQHGHAELGVFSAHQWSLGRGVTVAVVDSWVDDSHPELADQVADNRDFLGASAPPPDAEDFHGTAVAGVIASAAGNAIGIVGVAPAARLLALRACWAARASVAAHCDSFSLAKAISFAIEVDADVLNLSLGGPDDPLLHRLLSHAVEQGMVIVTAFSDRADRHFPGNHPGVIPVVGTGPVQIGTVRAPGDEIITTVPDRGYQMISGTSLAAAHISGIAALALEARPGTRASDLKRLLTSSPGLPDACWMLAELSPTVSCTRKPAGLASGRR